MKVLVSWISTADLLSVKENAEEDVKKIISQKTKNRKSNPSGPLITLASECNFDEIHLLCDWGKDIGDFFKKQLVERSNTKAKVEIHLATISSPIAYEEILLETDKFLDEVCSPLAPEDPLFILLTSGTPAMAASWVLLGKNKRYNTRFLQTFKDSENPEDKKYLLASHVIEEKIDISFRTERRYFPSIHGMMHIVEEGSQKVDEFQIIKGESESLRLAKGLAQRAASYDAPILLCGETGTGKELFAQAIHDASPRKKERFEALNCAAFPKELLESELFGFVKGAFTGAGNDKPGAFQRANNGTLFLDEIGECSLDMQAKLLRVLQPNKNSEGGQSKKDSKGGQSKNDSNSLTNLTFRPIGAQEDVRANVRIIAATNRDLRQMIRDKQFREDLFYRLAVIPITLLPLREREGDIEILANDILKNFNDLYKQNNKYQPKKLSPEALDFIKSQDWPGNVRQLYNVIWYAVVMVDGTEIKRETIEAAILHGPYALVSANDREKEEAKKSQDEPHKPILNVDDVPLGNGFNIIEFVKNIKRKLTIKALKETDRNKTKAAQLLGYKNSGSISLKELDISDEDLK